MNEITAILGCRYPLLQGAMGVICNPELVAAVSEAGGFGLLATAFQQDPEALKAQIAGVRKLTDKPFGANLMPMNPLVMTFAQILADAGVRAVTTSGGPPDALVPFLKERGVRVLHVAANVRNARKAEAAGVDAVIAEGMESGGMQGTNGVGAMVLVPAVVDAIKLPVVAAGGIGDARGYKAAFALGAKGVQIGTRFIASTECAAHAAYKQSLVEAEETGTTLVGAANIRFRVVRRPELDRMNFESAEEALKSITTRIEDSWLRGDLEASPLAAGQIAGLVREIKPVRDIIAEIVT